MNVLTGNSSNSDTVSRHFLSAVYRRNLTEQFCQNPVSLYNLGH